MIVDLERRGRIGAQTGESTAVPDGRIQMIVDALVRLGISSVYHTEGINSADPMAVIADGLYKVAQARAEQEDVANLTIAARPNYDDVIEAAQIDSAAAIVPPELGVDALREQHMGRVAFVPLPHRLSVLVVAPLHVISPRDFKPITNNLPSQGA